MNKELSKIRKTRNYKEEINRSPIKIRDDRLNEIMFELNTNMSEVSRMIIDDNVDIDSITTKIIANIYIVLSAFNEMGIYPDYFYDELYRIKVDFRKELLSDSKYQGDYREVEKLKISKNAELSRITENGVNNNRGNIQAYEKKDINKNYQDMIAYFNAFNIPHGTCTKEECVKAFEKSHFNHCNIIQHLLSSDVLSDDVESFVRLLFEYVSFFVAVGIPPKDLLDEYIEKVAGIKETSENTNKTK